MLYVSHRDTAMGSDQSSQLPAGAPGSRIKSQRDEDIPYTSYSISKPIAGGKSFTFISVREINKVDIWILKI